MVSGKEMKFGKETLLFSRTLQIFLGKMAASVRHARKKQRTKGRKRGRENVAFTN